MNSIDYKMIFKHSIIILWFIAWGVYELNQSESNSTPTNSLNSVGVESDQVVVDAIFKNEDIKQKELSAKTKEFYANISSERIEIKQVMDNRTPEERIRAAREEGAKALEEFDDAIRDNTQKRRNILEKAAVSHKHYNISANIAVDSYTMKDGRYITCSTKVLPTAPAVFDCDGEP